MRLIVLATLWSDRNEWISGSICLLIGPLKLDTLPPESVKTLSFKKSYFFKEGKKYILNEVELKE
jgi:hypothetical protein